MIHLYMDVKKTSAKFVKLSFVMGTTVIYSKVFNVSTGHYRKIAKDFALTFGVSEAIPWTQILKGNLTTGWVFDAERTKEWPLEVPKIPRLERTFS